MLNQRATSLTIQKFKISIFQILSHFSKISPTFSKFKIDLAHSIFNIFPKFLHQRKELAKRFKMMVFSSIFDNFSFWALFAHFFAHFRAIFTLSQYKRTKSECTPELHTKFQGLTPNTSHKRIAKPGGRSRRSTNVTEL